MSNWRFDLDATPFNETFEIKTATGMVRSVRRVVLSKPLFNRRMNCMTMECRGLAPVPNSSLTAVAWRPLAVK